MKTDTEETLVMAPDAGDHMQGTPDAPLTLVEYGDYECPYCADAHLAIRAVQERIGQKLRFVYRNFPLVDLHPHAMAAAEAAEAAGLQGKFWAMHDLLYRNQRRLEPQALIGYAESLNLDMDEFAADIRDGKASEKIRRDMESGNQGGVSGTPWLYINGRVYAGPRTPQALQKALEAAQ